VATGPENCVLRVMERSFADPSPIYPPGKDGEGPYEKGAPSRMPPPMLGTTKRRYAYF